VSSKTFHQARAGPDEWESIPCRRSSGIHRNTLSRKIDAYKLDSKAIAATRAECSQNLS